MMYQKNAKNFTYTHHLDSATAILLLLYYYTRLPLRLIRDTKGTIHAKMGTIKDRNGRDLTAAEGIKKMWQEYKEEDEQS